jgi:hypothetical protein
MITDTQLNFFSVFIFLGVVQGIILSWFFIIKGSRGRLANLFQGLLIFTLSCSMFEGIYPQGNFSWHHLWFIAYLFFIALFISPFLNYFRGKKFGRFASWFEEIAAKPLALNIVLIPILLSQIVLGQYFEVGTNALIDDWASMSFYLLFFLSGLVMLPSKKISEAIQS